MTKTQSSNRWSDLASCMVLVLPGCKQLPFHMISMHIVLLALECVNLQTKILCRQRASIGLTCFRTLAAGTYELQTPTARLRALPFRFVHPCRRSSIFKEAHIGSCIYCSVVIARLVVELCNHKQYEPAHCKRATTSSICIKSRVLGVCNWIGYETSDIYKAL